MTAALSLQELPTIQHAHARPWTKEEDGEIRARYQTVGAAALARDLARPLASVQRRAAKLKVYTHRRWTKAEDRKLTMLWSECGLTALAKEMQRTKSATWLHASRIGLPLGCPRGMAYLTDEAKRTGFQITALRRILRWADVPIRRSMARPVKATWHKHIVDPVAVDAAIDRWMKTESFDAAATARGISPTKLRSVLATYGEDLPQKPGNKQRWRIPSEQIDAAIAARARLVSIGDAARSAGMCPSTLQGVAKRMGIPRPPGKLWLVERVAIMRLIEDWRAGCCDGRRTAG